MSKTCDNCECKGSSHIICLCPLHEAGPALLAAAEAALALLDGLDASPEEYMFTEGKEQIDLRIAIAKARGQEGTK